MSSRNEGVSCWVGGWTRVNEKRCAKMRQDTRKYVQKPPSPGSQPAAAKLKGYGTGPGDCKTRRCIYVS